MYLGEVCGYMNVFCDGVSVCKLYLSMLQYASSKEMHKTLWAAQGVHSIYFQKDLTLITDIVYSYCFDNTTFLTAK